MKYELVEIDPSLAAKMLEKNTSNRGLRKMIVDGYAQDMKDGKWTLSPAPLVVTPKGNLPDGQHRLWAVVKSGTTQQFMVCTMDRECTAMDLNLDDGVKRSAKDCTTASKRAIESGNVLLRIVLGRVPTRSESICMGQVIDCLWPAEWPMHGNAKIWRRAPIRLGALIAYVSSESKPSCEFLHCVRQGSALARENIGEMTSFVGSFMLQVNDNKFAVSIGKNNSACAYVLGAIYALDYSGRAKAFFRMPRIENAWAEIKKAAAPIVDLYWQERMGNADNP